MKYVCTDFYEECVGLGSSLEDAYLKYKNEAGGDEAPDECMFYEINNSIKVEVKLIPKTEVVITEAGRLPKSRSTK